MQYNSTHMKEFFIGGREWKKRGGEVGNGPLGTGVAEEKREKDRQRSRETERGEDGERQREMGGGQNPPFKRECSECVQEVLLVAATEDVSYQDQGQASTDA